MAGFGTTEDKAIIVGGGFGALSAAVALQRVGIQSVVLERASELRQEGFAIGCFTNAWRAMDELGAGDAIREGHLSLKALEIKDFSGALIKRMEISKVPPPPHRPYHELRAVRRERIPRVLTSLLPPGTVHYSATVVGVTADDKGAEVELEGGRKLPCRVAILGDGIYSKTAAKLHKAELKYMHTAAWRGQVELPGDVIDEPRGAFVQGPNIRVGCIPMSYNEATKTATWFWFLALSVDKEEDFGTPEQHKQRIVELIKDCKVERVHKVLEQTPPDGFRFNHIYQRQVVAGRPWFDGCLTGVGDAAHATTPFLAQGGAMALEDGVELGVALKTAMQKEGVPFAQLSPAALVTALREYEILRSHRVAEIISKSRFSGQLSIMQNPVVGTIMRWLLPYIIRPAFFFGHTGWEPSGSLMPKDATK